MLYCPQTKSEWSKVGLCPLFFRYLLMKSLEVIDRVRKAVEPVLADAGTEVIDIEYRREPIGMVLRVFIDRPEGVSLEACSAASGLIDAELDKTEAIKGSYHLEVSSPGVERRLTKPEHFRRFAGSPARVKTGEAIEGRRVFEGRLGESDDGTFALETDEGIKRFRYSEIARVNLKFIDW